MLCEILKVGELRKLICLTSKNRGVSSVTPEFFQCKNFLSRSVSLYSYTLNTGTQNDYVCFFSLTSLWHTRDEGGRGEMGTCSLTLFYKKQGSCTISRGVSLFPIG